MIVVIAGIGTVLYKTDKIYFYTQLFDSEINLIKQYLVYGVYSLGLIRLK